MTKVAIVTGSNKGIGLAIVRGLAKTFDGDVYLTSRNEERGLQAVQKLNDQGINVLYHQLDISNESSVVKLASDIEKKHGGIEILVNNASIAFEFNEEPSKEPFAYQAKETIHTNYFGTRMVCKHLFPLLRSGARVVNMSSDSGFLAMIPGETLRNKLKRTDLSIDELDNIMNDFVDAAQAGKHEANGWPKSSYEVSKVGICALSRIQQREMASKEDVVINYVHPGYVLTDMTSNVAPLTTDQGAKSALYAATLSPGTDIRGQFIWRDCTLVDWVDGYKPDDS